MSIAISFFIAALSLSSAQAASVQETNKKVVTDFYEMAFNQHRPTEAAKR